MDQIYNQDQGGMTKEQFIQEKISHGTKIGGWGEGDRMYERYLLGEDEDYQPSQQQKDAATTKQLIEKNKKELEIADRTRAKTALRNRYLDYYENWSPGDAAKYQQEWINKHKYTQLYMYDKLMEDEVAPWTIINNCARRAPPNPAGSNHFDINQYYNYIVPECGTIWDWYNTPNANTGSLIQRGDLYIKFTTSLKSKGGIISNEVKDGVQEIVDKGGKKISETIEGAKTPYYFSMVAGVIALIAIAIIKVG